MNHTTGITALIDFGQSEQTNSGMGLPLVRSHERFEWNVAVFNFNVKILPLEQTHSDGKKKDQRGQKGGPLPGASCRSTRSELLRQPLGRSMHVKVAGF
jgi:hypothetical protein